MIVLEDYHELPSVLWKEVLASITNVRFELQVRDLKLGVKIDTICPMTVTNVTGLEFASIIIGARNTESSTHWW